MVTNEEKIAEQDEKIQVKGIVISMVSAFIFWLPFYFLNR
jgi:hypothetical protein